MERALKQERPFSDFFNVAASRPAKSPPGEFRDWHGGGQSVLISFGFTAVSTATGGSGADARKINVDDNCRQLPGAAHLVQSRTSETGMFQHGHVYFHSTLGQYDPFYCNQ